MSVQQISPAAAIPLRRSLNEFEERIIIRLVALGLRDEQIAERLHLRTDNFSYLLASLSKKYGCESRLELVIHAYQAGILCLSSIRIAR
jgi:DNA-binding CsgD family transcriptional regulator